MTRSTGNTGKAPAPPDRAGRAAGKRARRARQQAARPAAKAAAQARREARRVQDIVPPEGVPIHFRIAGLGERLFAQVTDILLSLAGLSAILILMAAAGIPGPLLFGVGVLLFFFLRIPYYILTELLWNGATLGKRMTGLRVVNADGAGLSAHAVVVRNLMKEAEVFLPATLALGLGGSDPVTSIGSALWCAICLAIPLANRRRQRLGDLIAGTCVIHQPAAVLLPDAADLARPDTGARYAFQPHNLDHYGAYELQTLEKLLQRRQGGSDAVRAANLAAIVDSIRRKIGYGYPVPADEHEVFLTAFYHAQRAYLEQRQLFGERRADKHHGAQD